MYQGGETGLQPDCGGFDSHVFHASPTLVIWYDLGATQTRI